MDSAEHSELAALYHFFRLFEQFQNGKLCSAYCCGIPSYCEESLWLRQGYFAERGTQNAERRTQNAE